MRSSLRVLILHVALGASLSQVASAGWPNNPNFNLPVATGAADQSASHLLADGAGGVFVTWTSGNAGSLDIYVQHLDSQGATLWAAAGVPVCTAPSDQAFSKLVPDGAGGVVVVWNDARTGSSFDLYAQRVQASGVPAWTANGLPIATGVGDQANVQAIHDGATGAILTWTDTRSGNTDIYAQRVSLATGAAQWSLNGVPVCAASGNQTDPLVISDGAGGAIIAWVDSRIAGSDIYAQRVDPAGARLWAANGVPVCVAASAQEVLSMATDQAGGAYLTWQDYRGGAIAHVFAQRINGSGMPLWTVDGIKMSTEPNGGLGPVVTSDMAGGCVIAWEDYRGPDSPDLYAQRLNASGNALWGAGGAPLCVMPGAQYLGALLPDGLGGVIGVWEDFRPGGGGSNLYGQRLHASGGDVWSAGGAALSTAAMDQFAPSLASDGKGGLIAAFTDRRNGVNADLFAQNVERFGQLGHPEPDISGVRDIVNDQGGQVRVSWAASYLDQGPGSLVDSYRLWRQVPAAQARQHLARGAKLVKPGEAFGRKATKQPRRFRWANAASFFWELVGTQVANGFSGYSLVTTTVADSTPASNPHTVFMVEAVYETEAHHWDSAPDSGYSVDNLAPPPPSSFTGTYSNLIAELQWSASPAADLSLYRLYRGGTQDFVPGPGNLILSALTHSHVDNAGGPAWYKLSAVDVHGNEGPVVTLFPSGAVDVPPAQTPAEVSLARPAPNPMRGQTAFRLGLPRAAWVRAALFDERGRRIGLLADGELPAGEHVLRWAGRREDGVQAPSGVYFYRIELEGRRLEGRLTLVR